MKSFYDTVPAAIRCATTASIAKAMPLALALGVTLLSSSLAVAEGTTAGWGINNHGQLGDNSTAQSLVPVVVNTSGVLAGKTVTQISAGFTSACVVTADGGAYCWGYNNIGQLGNNSTTESLVPVAVYTTGVLAGKTVTQISAGSASACAVASDGGAFCWGFNSSGELGNNSTAQSLVPVAVDTGGVLAGKTVSQIRAGNGSACAVASDGGAYCWGLNSNGQLGNNSTLQSLVPVAVDTSGVLAGKTVIQISAGLYHSCAVTSDGGAYCWGSNNQGQLGNNSTLQSLVPVAVDTSGVLAGKTVTQVSAGGGNTCAVTSDGGAYCWGSNSNGELGNNSTVQSLVPVSVDSSGALLGKFVIQIETGRSFSLSSYSCAQTSDGGAYCWGFNANGQLGNNSTAQALVPVAVDTSGVLNGKFVSQVSAGDSFSSAAAPAGGPGRPIASGASAVWQQMAPTCTPVSASVQTVFGTGSPMNLTTANYNVPNAGAGTGWVVFKYNPVANQYVTLAATDTLTLGTGYWLFSYQMGRQGKLIMNCPDTPPVAPVTPAQGCGSANGCVALPVIPVSGVDRSNLIGNPFPFAIDWSAVRVRIDGSPATYTPSQAACIGGCGGSNAPFPTISNVFYVWNGTSYSTYSDSGVTAGRLPYFSSFWVKALSTAYGHTIELLVPKAPTNSANPF